MGESDVEFAFIKFIEKSINYETVKAIKKYNSIKKKELLTLDLADYNGNIENDGKIIDSTICDNVLIEDEIIDRLMISKCKELLEVEEFNVVTLNIIQDIPQKEVAKMLNKSQSSISKIKKKALKKIKKFLEDS
ncbi:sigma factor-like helix-turn-helix DNA-binding protein [Thermoanaerobacterium sp. CMT5567-10]|uniref:sigma factor-like helix-turn-helix DNA-binding protein n=1 Tax=Thermoanaerobacterium sp. CMT5567-10 TaxID=3061989 RepID=UPI0026DF9068|nr:sigma factor-like helix-turn-helix DNA-binding protein [Thermoanaerobacterium sp. CMT5567-10]WKV07814.1 sigma factor-like helix-turn-helix DNA-binding protein [Thermoanaerobacterium sp. CMT5567-10]